MKPKLKLTLMLLILALMLVPAVLFFWNNLDRVWILLIALLPVCYVALLLTLVCYCWKLMKAPSTTKTPDEVYYEKRLSDFDAEEQRIANERRVRLGIPEKNK